MSNEDPSFDTTSLPTHTTGLMTGTGGRNTQQKNFDNPLSRAQRRANVAGQKKAYQKLNRMVSVTMRFRDAELRKVQNKDATLAEYLTALENHMLQSDREWRSWVRSRMQSSDGRNKMEREYIRRVSDIMRQLQRPGSRE